MNKRFIFTRFINILTFFMLCLVSMNSLRAQEASKPEKSLAVLYEEFNLARKMPCGERAEALRIGKVIIVKHGVDKFNKEVTDFVKNQTARIEKDDESCKAEFSLYNLFERFKAAGKQACGERSGAIQIGSAILERYVDDRENRDVIEFVKKRVEKFELEDQICAREKAYIAAYRAKNWGEVFRTGKIIIDAEGDKRKALDVMIDLASVGYDLAAYENEDAYDVETAGYALKAIELIENGVRTNAGWGAFSSFKNREKALGWLNYIVGYISYLRLKGNKKAIPYFYKATKYKMEFKNDAFIYQAVAIYYFDRQASMASGLEINSFINKAQGLTGQTSGESNDFTAENAEDNEIAVLYKNLVTYITCATISTKTKT